MFAVKIAYARALSAFVVAISYVKAQVAVAEGNTRFHGLRVRARAEIAARRARQARTDEARLLYQRLAEQEAADLLNIATKAWD